MGILYQPYLHLCLKTAIFEHSHSFYKISIMKKITFIFLTLCCSSIFKAGFSQTRSEFLLEKDWKFTREDPEGAMRGDFDDSGWQNVRVPHDWAIYGPFNANNDKQKVAIVQDGQKEASSQAGRTGGLPFIGTGWYRVRFSLPGYEAGNKVSILFDGAMSNAQVWVNGQLAGNWPYGYNSFHFDITKLVNPTGENQLAVRLENYPESSRWYPGAGMYRNVHLIMTKEAHIPVWGTTVTTPVIKKEYAKVNLSTKIERHENSSTAAFSLYTEIRNSTGNTVAFLKSDLRSFDENSFDQMMVVSNPELWEPDHPVLYSAYSRLSEGNIVRDEYTTTFGIRSIEIIPDSGFFLNGKKTQFKGVCNHHDLGPLGAAVNEAAIRRQVRILKDMGCNAIRTSHNMPAPELVKACDEMGMMIMAETFDEWKTPKMKNGYHLYFDKWAEKDLVNLIHHYRNNPSVVMWCVGNEVPDQGTANGPKLARFLRDICHREDPTRPVTVGMDRVDNVLSNNFAAVLDVAGFNYRTFKYQEAYKKLPQQIVLGAETASTVSSRGVYKFPVMRKSMAKYDDHQSSSYDLEHCDWSDLPEDNFILHEDLPYCIGEFVWTGFDYLGEPTPYYSDWPSHSSLFGIIDLAGIPKDRYYLYRSHWNKKENTLHILPHWNWNGHEGENIPVMVYTSYPSAELFINGKSQGKQAKDLSFTVNNTGSKTSQDSLNRQKRYRLMWMETKYEPGALKVVAYDSQGNKAAEAEIRTAGKPDHIQLSADREIILANGKDLSFISVKMVDKDGNLCPEDNTQIRFKVKGPGTFKAAANGNPVSLESFQAPAMKLFYGQLTAIVQSSETPGTIIFEASADGVKPGSLTLTGQQP
jgi:beta-galactosidase